LKKLINIDYQLLNTRIKKFTQTNYAVWGGLGRLEELMDKHIFILLINPVWRVIFCTFYLLWL